MRGVLIGTLALGVGFGVASLVLAPRHDASVETRDEVSPPAPAADPQAPAPRWSPSGTKVLDAPTIASDLREEDPIAATTVIRALDLAAMRLFDQAWRRHRGTGDAEPTICTGPTVQAVTLRVDIDAVAERLTMSAPHVIAPALDADTRDCLERWFAGSVDVTDEEAGGPFPDLRVAVDRPVAFSLGERLDGFASRP